MTAQRSILTALDRACGDLPPPPCRICGWPERHTPGSVMVEDGIVIGECRGCGGPIAPDGSPLGAQDPDGGRRLSFVVLPPGADMGEHMNDQIIRHPA